MTCVADLPAGLEPQVHAALERLEARAGKRLGDPRDPLLVTRSGRLIELPRAYVSCSPFRVPIARVAAAQAALAA